MTLNSGRPWISWTATKRNKVMVLLITHPWLSHEHVVLLFVTVCSMLWWGLMGDCRLIIHSNRKWWGRWAGFSDDGQQNREVVSNDPASTYFQRRPGFHDPENCYRTQAWFGCNEQPPHHHHPPPPPPPARLHFFLSPLLALLLPPPLFYQVSLGLAPDGQASRYSPQPPLKPLHWLKKPS